MKAVVSCYNFLHKNVKKIRFLLFETVHLECLQLRSFTLKVHQNRWLTALPKATSWIKGLFFKREKGKGGKERREFGPSQCWKQIDATDHQVS